MVVSSFNQFAIAQIIAKYKLPYLFMVKIFYFVTTFAGCYIKIDIFYQPKDEIYIKELINFMALSEFVVGWLSNIPSLPVAVIQNKIS